MHATAPKNITKIFLFGFLLLGVTLSGCVSNISREEEFDRSYKGLNEDESSFSRSCAAFLKYGAASGDYLIKKLKTENNLHIKTEAISLIGFIGCTNCADEMAFYLNDPYWRVRFFTLDTLDKLHYGKIREVAREAIEKDPHESVRLGAIMLLGKKKNADDAPFLQALKKKNLNDEKMLAKGFALEIPARPLL